MCPWQLLSSAATFISVLSAYSVFLGPMVGIMVCDCTYRIEGRAARPEPSADICYPHPDWILRDRRIKLTDLYHPGKDGVYHT